MTSPSKDRAEAVRAAIEFLGEAANYFEARPTGGEDKAHWSNVYNAQNCRKASELLATAHADGFAEGMKRAAEIAHSYADFVPGLPSHHENNIRCGVSDAIAAAILDAEGR